VKVRGSFRLFFCIVVLAFSAVAATNKVSPDLASANRKIAHLEANARVARPDPKPTILTEPEVNAYLASDNVQFPAGVESVRLSGSKGNVSGAAKVDFDKVREGVRSSNPLLSIFSGIHDVQVETHAYGRGGMGYIHVDSVSLDGIQVPQFVLNLFVEKYISSRYPDIGIDSRFKLPDRIDSAVVGEHQLTLLQK
jgi:hypothetical protein